MLKININSTVEGGEGGNFFKNLQNLQKRCVYLRTVDSIHSLWFFLSLGILFTITNDIIAPTKPPKSKIAVIIEFN